MTATSDQPPLAVQDASVTEIESTKKRLRSEARAMMGVSGGETTEPLLQGLQRTDTTLYPLVAMSLLALVDQFQGQAFFILGPEISRNLGISRTTLGGLVALKVLILSLATFPMAGLVQQRARRAWLSIATGFGWSVATLATGFTSTVWGLFGVLAADGASTGSVAALHQPLIIDSYPPSLRVRVLTIYHSAQRVGEIAAPLVVLACTVFLDLTWRGVFVVMGGLCIAASLFSLRLRDPGFGTFDAERVRAAVRGRDSGLAQTSPGRVHLGFFEIVRRLLLIPTMRSLLFAEAALGMMLIPLNTYVFFYMQERWGLGPGGRAAIFAVLPLFSLVALTAYTRRGEALFQTDPSRFLRIAMYALLGAGSSILLIIHAPVLPVFIVCAGLFGASLAVAFTVLQTSMLSIIQPEMRPHASALAGVFLAGVGGFAGLILMGGFDRRFGTGAAISVLALPAAMAAMLVVAAARRVNRDFDRMVDDLVEEEEVLALHESGTRLPLLSCRHIDFFHGQVQTLFDVNFTVAEGEMVALLGTNGAGKSTLLRIISGLGLPAHGTIRLDGGDITFVGAERRVAMGIAQIAGGQAIFPTMSVADNLRVFSTTTGKNRRSCDRAIEVSFETFPGLANRRNVDASLLSGGQQQMLALSKALILRPRLLLIDELSLGLSPLIVSQLMEMVRNINAAGTALVLVEQSVNVALSLVEHAYFMEKGQMRFDGAAGELLGRDDLLRSVFLEGAGAGLTR